MPQRDHDDKGFNSSSHDDHVGKPSPIQKAMKIPNAKAAFDKRSDKPEKLPAWQVEEVKSLKEVIERHKKRERLSTQEAMSRYEATLEGRFRLVRCFLRARTFSVSNDVDYQNAQDKQVTPKSKWRTLHPCSTFRNRNVPISGSDYHDTCVQKPSKTFLLKGVCTDTLLLRCCGTDSSRRSC